MGDKVKDYPPYLDYPKERKPMTNADRIRAMTDEEMAVEYIILYDKFSGNDREELLEWLKQETE